METANSDVRPKFRVKFQKDLVVWKQVFERLAEEEPQRFQKDLVVWKREVQRRGRA